MRVLVVLTDPVDSDALRERFMALVVAGEEVAVCYTLYSQPTLQATLDAQRKITAALRRALGGSAESIPVFVVCAGDRDGIADCAREWGATEVQT